MEVASEVELLVSNASDFPIQTRNFGSLPPCLQASDFPRIPQGTAEFDRADAHSTTSGMITEPGINSSMPMT
jgi:hypothetical protein